MQLKQQISQHHEALGGAERQLKEKQQAAELETRQLKEMIE